MIYAEQFPGYLLAKVWGSFETVYRGLLSTWAYDLKLVISRVEDINYVTYPWCSGTRQADPVLPQPSDEIPVKCHPHFLILKIHYL
jgi:hypothetical protein